MGRCDWLQHETFLSQLCIHKGSGFRSYSRGILSRGLPGSRACSFRSQCTMSVELKTTNPAAHAVSFQARTRIQTHSFTSASCPLREPLTSRPHASTVAESPLAGLARAVRPAAGVHPWRQDVHVWPGLTFRDLHSRLQLFHGRLNTPTRTYLWTSRLKHPVPNRVV